MAKQVKFTGGDLDRISHLADPILCHILTFLPIEEAVKTSILASRWRYLFASMPVLDFDGLSGKPGNFKNFVDRLLFFPSKVSLDCFRMSKVPSNNDDFHFYGWICAALWRDVKQIDISFSNQPLPAHLFTSQSLVSLKLDVNKCDLNVPTKVCLPKLKTLHLSRFEFSDGSVFRLISSCHALEELTLSNCEFYNITEIKIHNDSLKMLDFDFLDVESKTFNCAFVLNAPNLVHFKYNDMIAESYSLSNMASLEQAHINACPFNFTEPEDVELERYATLLQAVSNVQSLRVVIFSDEDETILQPSLEPMRIFHNLVELRVDGSCVLWLMEFLLFTPNLKSLILSHLIMTEDFGTLSDGPACLLSHLKEIKVLRFIGGEIMFRVISYFLSHGFALEKLVIEIEIEKMSYRPITETEQLRITKKLLELPRKSERCRVVIL